MKKSKIIKGGIYSDGKLGVREVVSIDFDDASKMRVAYIVHAAQVEVAMDYSTSPATKCSLIGRQSSCELTGFAAWAKLVVAQDNLPKILADMRVARKIKLATGEEALMSSLAKEFRGDEEIPPNKGVKVECCDLNKRVSKGLVKKGLIEIEDQATLPSMPTSIRQFVTLTELGAAWIRAYLK